ncbi:hypothetical protein FBZ94_11083 [Bradyrhizobium sacchari]|uniref:Uncharacterized protein n=1 Tax=Bradyrhizobium sacchari TaxID=1399419 RepID=A0A560HX80_9BRAD|nr:hypothetical protein FBZ94_11083 [Bradyrhizobium sacchari]TWB69487.1 hypothetical protein FBZ95_10983 [Bradyrhizobium sacchari]
MFKGFTVTIAAVVFSAHLDQYLTYGRYTDAAIAMLRQIRHAFGF